MAIYTYEEVKKKAQASGFALSDADDALAKQNPDAGMSIVNYKNDFLNAKSEEERVLANLGAERIRSEYGNYTGGSDGSGFYAGEQTAPVYEDKYADTWKELLAKQQEMAAGIEIPTIEKPTYTARYDNSIQNLTNKISNYEPFVYDPQTDPLYASYRKQYAREGRRASAEALALASAATGGRPSSYAMTAAAQAANNYAAKTADKIPELYAYAYQQYGDRYTRLLSELSALRGLAEEDYQHYLDRLNDYRTDREWDYRLDQERYDRLLDSISTVQGLEELAQQAYQQKLEQYNKDREYRYTVAGDRADAKAAEQQLLYEAEQAALDRALETYLTQQKLQHESMEAEADRAWEKEKTESQQKLSSDQYERELQLKISELLYEQELAGKEYENQANLDRLEQLMTLAKMLSSYDKGELLREIAALYAPQLEEEEEYTPPQVSLPDVVLPEAPATGTPENTGEFTGEPSYEQILEAIQMYRNGDRSAAVLKILEKYLPA